MGLTPIVLTTQAGPQGNLPRSTSSRYPSASPLFPSHGPRPDYLANLQQPSCHVETPRAKSCLLVLDIDNTLIKPVEDGDETVAARPFLRPFLEWVLDPRSPYAVAVSRLARLPWHPWLLVS